MFNLLFWFNLRVYRVFGAFVCASGSVLTNFYTILIIITLAKIVKLII